MKILRLVLMIAIIAALPSCSFAEDSKAQTGELSAYREAGHVIPFSGNQNTGAAQSEVDKKNFMDSHEAKVPEPQAYENEPGAVSDGMKEVSYDKDGKITELTMDDGTVVTYKHNKDDKSLTLESKQYSIALAFKETAKRSSDSEKANITDSADGGKGKGGIIVEIYLEKPPIAGSSGGLNDGKAGIAKPAFQVVCPDTAIPVAKLAVTPMKFDFREIKKAIEKTSEMRAQALKEYKHNTSDYYDALEAAIKKNIGALEEGGIDLNGLEGRVSAANKQNAVEMVVENIYAHARKGGSDKAIIGIMSLEKELMERIISPEKEAYESRVREATEYTDDMIEKLVKSQLALYLKIKKDKIDVIINLQKTPRKPNK